MMYPEARFDGEMGERQRHTLGDGGRGTAGGRQKIMGGRGEKSRTWSTGSKDGEDVGGLVSKIVAGS